MCYCLCLQLNDQSSLQNLQTRIIHIQGSDTEHKPPGADSSQPYSQVELNYLTRDLGLSKEAAVLLGFKLQEKCLMGKSASFYW
ncbi:hypothetical protein NPIL_492511 [Nephila pilipes]|uniref:Uncharacterized protein n=1 Tax=Nephila pilipes TaxID=299642 RepID=A0A8X6PHR5_NEPPI|nr:hypothetical protein NPIL_492511 [Nephila pilipes]